jgi:transcriptional regulator with GAF, ATPase, and Fis domain
VAERLVVYRDSEVVKSVPLRGAGISIGRKSVNDVVLDDLSISKQHAVITREGQTWYIRDLESTNGVMLSGVKVKSAPLTRDKEFKLGNFTVKFEVTDDEAGPASTPKGIPDEAYQDLQALFRLNGRFASVINTEELLHTMMDKLLEIFRADRGFVLLGTDADEGLETAVRRGIEAAGEDVATSRTIIRRALESGEPIVTTDQEAFPETVEKSIRSILCAPLMEGEEPMGVVYLDSRIISRVFTDQDRVLLEVFCEQVAGAYRAAEERERVAREVSHRKLLARQDALREHDFRDIIGTSTAIRDTLEQVEAVAPQDVTVLISGESGTGKELFAKAIHYNSSRSDGPFVAINCMALSHEIIESELFGHEKGAFSGAIAQRIGKLELGDGGTVFLDEIGELTHEVQVKLLRVLEEREIQRVGGNKSIPLNVRLVTATNVDLKKAVAAGRFREDLYYRLNVFTLHLPPLRDRREDVPELVTFFIDVMNEKMGRSVAEVADDALEALKGYDWPGNVRELRNVIERGMVLTKGDTLKASALPFDLRSGAAGVPSTPGALQGVGLFATGVSGESTIDLSDARDMREAKEQLEKKMILAALDATHGNISAAARNLRLQRKTLHRKVETLGIDMRRFGKNRDALTREQVVAALLAVKGSISAAARELEVPRTTLYRNMEMFGVDIEELRKTLE